MSEAWDWLVPTDDEDDEDVEDFWGFPRGSTGAPKGIPRRFTF